MDQLIGHPAVTVCLHIMSSHKAVLQSNKPACVCTRCDPLIRQMWLFDAIFQSWGTEKNRLHPQPYQTSNYSTSRDFCITSLMSSWLETRSASLTALSSLLSETSVWCEEARWNTAATLSSTRECLTCGCVESVRLHDGAVYQHRNGSVNDRVNTSGLHSESACRNLLWKSMSEPQSGW